MTSNINNNTSKCSNVSEKIGIKFTHLENPYFSLRKKPRDDTSLPKKENISLATQTKHKSFHRKVYNMETVRLEDSGNAYKVRSQKPPIITDKRNQEKIINVQSRKYDKPKSIQRMDREQFSNEKTIIHAKSGFVLRSNPHKPTQEQRKVLENELKRSNEPKRSEMKETKNSSNHKSISEFRLASKVRQLMSPNISLNMIKKPKISPEYKPKSEFLLTNKIRQLMSRDVILNLDDEKNASEIGVPETVIKQHILSVIKKSTKKQLKHRSSPPESETSKNSLSSVRHHRKGNAKKRNAIKSTVRRQLWEWAKVAIKNNERWSKLFKDNNIAINNVNIDGIDPSLIDVDALGIESKFLKRTIIWLLK